MAEKENASEDRTSPTRGGATLGRALLHDGIGVNIPEFLGWVADWGKGILRSGAYLLTGELKRPDFYANGPGDRSLGKLWGRWGSMVIGQPLSEAGGVGHIRTKDDEENPNASGALGVNVSFDSGKTWEKASTGEATAHWTGVVADPTFALPVIGAKSTVSIIKNVATKTDKALAVSGLSTMGPALGNDLILRGMILHPNEAMDALDVLMKPKSLETKQGIDEFNQAINFLLAEEYHKPLNDSKKTLYWPWDKEGTSPITNKNADPAHMKHYLPSLDPDQGTLQLQVASDQYVELKKNYRHAAQEIQIVIERAQNNIASGNAKVQDYEVVRSAQKFDKKFNEVVQKYLAQGDRIDLTATDMMILNFKMHPEIFAPMTMQKSETLGYLQEYLQTSYKSWAKTPGGETAIRTGVQLGALAPLDSKQSTIPTAHLRFMMSVQQSLVDKELNSFENPIVPLNRNDPGVATEAAKTALKTTPGLTMAP